MSSLSWDWRSSGITGTRRSIPNWGFLSIAAALFEPPFLPSAAAGAGFASGGREASAALISTGLRWGASLALFFGAAAGFERSLSRATEATATVFSAATVLTGLPAGADGRFLAATGAGLCLRVVMISGGGERLAFPLCAGREGPTQGAPKQSGQLYLTREQTPNSTWARGASSARLSNYKLLKFLEFIGSQAGPATFLLQYLQTLY